jgi:hypothetical protein
MAKWRAANGEVSYSPLASSLSIRNSLFGIRGSRVIEMAMLWRRSFLVLAAALLSGGPDVVLADSGFPFGTELMLDVEPL